MADKNASDVFVPGKTRYWSSYEQLGKVPDSDADSMHRVALVRLKDKSGNKILANVYLVSRYTQADKKNGYNWFDGDYPYYSGTIVNYVPISGPTFIDTVDPKSSLIRENPNENVYVRPGDMISVRGRDDTPKNFVMRFVDPQGAVWKIRSYPSVPSGQQKQILAWTDQYNENREDQVVEADTYADIKNAILAFQQGKTRSGLPTLNSTTLYKSSPKTISNLVVHETVSSDDKPAFFAVAVTPDAVTIGPSSSIEDLQTDVAAAASGSMRMGLAGGSGGNFIFSRTDAGPRTGFFSKIPWAMVGAASLTAAGLGAMVYAIKNAFTHSD